MYDHKQIEKKWQDFWEKNKTFKVENDFSKPKYYTLDMFPYPSGAGLHVGHPEGYTANDIVARYKHANGYNVLHPMGWDAFGLPAENYAIKTGTHPRITTDKNIQTFKNQIKSLGFSYDWDREIDTTDPKYYKWTQWIFLKLFEAGLAYEQDLPINYCPSCKTGLANEEVLNDFTCERCGTKVEKRKIKQWVLAITKYADRLLSDVDKLDWPESIKEMQRNWIGKSEGCEFEMKKSDDENKSIRVYTTRIDTVFGMTYAVLAPDHKDVMEFITDENKKACLDYIEKAKQKSDQDRTADNKEKTGVFTGSYVVNPYNNEKVPLWIADYVLGSYGTGAVMAVPAHDERDFEFANRYNLPVKQVIAPYIVMDGKSTPKNDDKITKFICTTAIINHPTEDLYLALKFKKSGEYGFVGGSLEDGEEFEEAIKREVFEETGYKNIEVQEVLFDLSYSRGYKARKDREEEAKERVFIVKLNDLEKLENHECDEHDEICWFDKKDVLSKVDLKHHKFFIEHYLKESRAYTDDGILLNSGDFDGLTSEKARDILTQYAEGKIIPNFEDKGKYAPRKDKETINRNGSFSIIEGPDGDEYLLLDWKETGWKSFVVGGLENGETFEDAAIREAKEETGYVDIKEIKRIGKENFNFFYAQHKGINRSTKQNNFLIKLNSLKKVDVDPNETINHNAVWVKKEEVSNFLNLENNLYVWHLLQTGKQIDFEYLSKLNSFNGFTQSDEYKFGTKKVNYKLRDWLFSRQRYWGEPIPLIHIELENLKKLPHITDLSQATDLKLAYILKREAKMGESCDRVSCGCGHIRELVIGGKVVSKIYDGIYTKIICDYNLPLELPQVENYEPSGDGNSPLAKVSDFVNIKLAENLSGKRETNTMPQWGGSCWYYLRFMDPDNQNELVSSEVEKYWGQVDSYVGGAEHAVLHLLYARFWHKFLYDIGVVSHDEPFYRLRNQGLILSYAFQRKNGGLVANDEVEEKNGKYFEIKTGEELTQIVSKMSKSLKNVVNPDDIINEFGADSLRLYEMYMADFKDSAPWDSKNIVGVRRFLDRVNSLYTGELEKFAETDEKAMKTLHKTIKKVGDDIENYKFNTAIAGMMICVNEGMPRDKILQKEWKEKFLIILHPFAPHLAEELWQLLGNKGTIFNSIWPKYDEKFVVDDTITIGVQVLGKLRGEIEIGVDEEQLSVLEKARNNSLVKKWLEGKEIVKEIYVKGKIVNIVVK